MEKSGYKIVGVLNYSNVYPDFTLPVFSRDNKKYIGILDASGIRYAGFAEIPKSLLKKVKLIDSFKDQLLSTNWDHYSVDDEVLISFCLDKDTVYVFTLNRAVNFFLGEYECTNDSFKASIDETIKEIEEGKKYLKNLKTSFN